MKPTTRRSSRRRMGTVAGATAALISVAACGSTVRNAHEILAQRAQAGYYGAPGSTGGVTATTATPGTGEGGEVVVPPVPGTGNTAQPGNTVAPGGSTHGSTVVPTATAPGNGGHRAVKLYKGPAKLSPVEIGVVHSQDLSGFAKLFGGTSDTGNLERYANAVIGYINSHGGLAGHVLRPVYYSIALTSTKPYSTTMAEICSTWTQDHKVAAGVAVGFNIPNDLAQCLSAKKIPYISGANYLHDATTYRQIPYLVSPYEAGTDSAMTALVSHLLSTGWLNAKSHVGVLLGTNESAAVRAYNNVVVPMLKGRVARVTSYGVDFPPSTQAAVATSQTVSNDELHARADGVTHMLFLAPGAEGSFIDDAYQQKWFPKYAVTSFDTPWGGAMARNKEERATLAGSIGIGWQPTMDVGTYGSNVFTNKTTELCKKILKRTGQLTNNVRVFAGYQYCDGLLFVKAAADASGASVIDGPAIRDGYNALGTSRPDAITFLSRLDPQQHNGASAYRPLAYSVGCSCFRYTGPVTNF